MDHLEPVEDNNQAPIDMLCGMFNTYDSQMVKPITTSYKCKMLIKAYISLLNEDIRQDCLAFLDMYNNMLADIDDDHLDTFFGDEGKIMSFFDCRNYSLYALLRPEDDHPIQIIYSDNKFGIITGHLFIHQLQDKLELISIQVDLYDSIVETKLGFSRYAFDYVFREIIPTLPDITYVYAVAWRTISNILVKNYGFSTLTYDPMSELFTLTDKSNTISFHKNTKNLLHRVLLRDLEDAIHDNQTGFCDPTCYILTFIMIID
jgi:hypothetical protein